MNKDTKKRWSPRRIYRYMHMLTGKPAFYQPGHQICFAHKCVPALATSLEQIRDEQRRSVAWRAKLGLMVDLPSQYGYVRVRIL